MSFAFAFAFVFVSSGAARADDRHLPADFAVHPTTWGGAGGGVSRAERAELSRYPVIMIPDLGRDHTDWTGANPGNASTLDSGSVYAYLRRAGFAPIELWMVDLARAGDEMTSLEEATDDLKFFITAVMQYTGAPKVQLLAHGTGCLLARLTLLKYNLAHFIAAEVYIAGPFHGETGYLDSGDVLRGHPNAWVVEPGNELLHEILLAGETPRFRDPHSSKVFSIPALTIRNGMAGGDERFPHNPDSPKLLGAQNALLPGLNHDGLRAAGAAASLFVPFLDRKTAPCVPANDRDGDGVCARSAGGADCDDSDPAIHPGAPEVPADGIDQDCNGCEFYPEHRRDGEIPL